MTVIGAEDVFTTVSGKVTDEGVILNTGDILGVVAIGSITGLVMELALTEVKSSPRDAVLFISDKLAAKKRDTSKRPHFLIFPPRVG